MSSKDFAAFFNWGFFQHFRDRAGHHFGEVNGPWRHCRVSKENILYTGFFPAFIARFKKSLSTPPPEARIRRRVLTARPPSASTGTSNFCPQRRSASRPSCRRGQTNDRVLQTLRHNNFAFWYQETARGHVKLDLRYRLIQLNHCSPSGQGLLLGGLRARPSRAS